MDHRCSRGAEIIVRLPPTIEWTTGRCKRVTSGCALVVCSGPCVVIADLVVTLRLKVTSQNRVVDLHCDEARIDKLRPERRGIHRCHEMKLGLSTGSGRCGGAEGHAGTKPGTQQSHMPARPAPRTWMVADRDRDVELWGTEEPW